MPKPLTTFLTVGLLTVGAASAALAADPTPAGQSSWTAAGHNLLVGLGVWAMWALPSLALAYCLVHFVEPRINQWLLLRRSSIRFDISLRDAHGRFHEAQHFVTPRAVIDSEPIDVLIVSYGDRHMRLFDTRTGANIRQIEIEGTSSVGLLAVTSKYLVFTTDGDRDIRRIPLVDLLTKAVGSYAGVAIRDPNHIGFVTALACTADNKVLAAGDSEGLVHLYALDSGRVIGRIASDTPGEHSAGEISSLSFHPLRPMIAIAGGGGEKQIGRAITFQFGMQNGEVFGTIPDNRSPDEIKRTIVTRIEKFHSDPTMKISHLQFSPSGDKLGCVLVNATAASGGMERIILKDITSEKLLPSSSQVMLDAPQATMLAFNLFNNRKFSWNRIASNGPRGCVWKSVDGVIQKAEPLAGERAEDSEAAKFVTFLQDPHRILKIGNLLDRNKSFKSQYVSIWPEARPWQVDPDLEFVEPEETVKRTLFIPIPLDEESSAPVLSEKPAATLFVPAHRKPPIQSTPMPWRHKIVYTVFAAISLIATFFSLNHSQPPAIAEAVKLAHPELQESVRAIHKIAEDAEMLEFLKQKDTAQSEWKIVIRMSNAINTETSPEYFKLANSEETNEAAAELAEKSHKKPYQVQNHPHPTLDDIGTLCFMEAEAALRLQDRANAKQAIDGLKSFPHARIAKSDGKSMSVSEAMKGLPLELLNDRKIASPTTAKLKNKTASIHLKRRAKREK